MIPHDDFREHEESLGCWCEPDTEELPEGTMFVHHAADHREGEDGRGYVPGKKWHLHTVPPACAG